MNESQNEKHRRVAAELGLQIIDEFPEIAEQILLIGTVATGLICVATKSALRRETLANAIWCDIKLQLEARKEGTRS